MQPLATFYLKASSNLTKTDQLLQFNKTTKTKTQLFPHILKTEDISVTVGLCGRVPLYAAYVTGR